MTFEYGHGVQQSASNGPDAAVGLFPEATVAASQPSMGRPDLTMWDPLLENTAFDGMGGMVPSFFEQIMVPGPDFLGTETAQMPPNIADLFPEQDWLGDLSIFDSDFIPAMDEALAVPAWPTPTAETVPDVSHGTPKPSSSLNRNEQARKRHAIFQRSPWMYIPKSHETAFTEHGDIRLEDSNLHSAASPHQPIAETLAMPDKLSLQSRDRILQLVLKTAKSQVSFPSFPTAETLELLMKMGIAKRLETDAWMNPYTFRSDDTRAELLTALVAAGCVCFGIKSVSRTGLVLLEIVRVALNKLVEEDSSAIRDLQYLQASMIWLDVSGFCG